jgi:hypothetical protein
MEDAAPGRMLPVRGDLPAREKDEEEDDGIRRPSATVVLRKADEYLSIESAVVILHGGTDLYYFQGQERTDAKEKGHAKDELEYAVRKDHSPSAGARNCRGITSEE